MGCLDPCLDDPSGGQKLGARHESLGVVILAEHWSKLRSTNPLERVNREIGRRTDVVGIFPNDAPLLRLAGMLLLEQNDEWLVDRRSLSEPSMTPVLAADTADTTTISDRRYPSSPRHDHPGSR